MRIIVAKFGFYCDEITNPKKAQEDRGKKYAGLWLYINQAHSDSKEETKKNMTRDK